MVDCEADDFHELFFRRRKNRSAQCIVGCKDGTNAKYVAREQVFDDLTAKNGWKSIILSIWLDTEVGGFGTQLS